MQNFMNSVKMSKPKTNMFDLTHDVKLSCNMGFLIPTLAIDCIPGDKFNLSAESLTRFAPLVSPVMHRFDVFHHYFFVPNRILWPNWENYISGTKVGGAVPAHPYITIPADGTPGQYTKLHDYMGVPNPINTGEDEKVNALPFAAYQKIWNEYYRDQNLIPDAAALIQLIDGENLPNFDTLSELRKRAWEHDYFTSNLPFVQKGDAVTIPLGNFSDVPVKLDEGNYPAGTTLDGTPGDVFVGPDGKVGTFGDDMFAKTSDLVAQAATINDLRTAFSLQKFLEKAARGGTRLKEFIKVMFGVNSPDARLQRPEYITGAKSPLVVSEVLQTSQTDTSPQGNMAGHAFGVAQGKFGSYYCQEHGYIICMTSVMPKTAYQQGLEKHLLRIGDRTQYFFPDFAHLGEQAVENREIYAFAPPGTGDDTFGYIPRYAEYRVKQNRVCGDFRTTLNFWHDGRIFNAPPALNQQFIECTPSYRIFAVTDPNVDHIYMQVLHKIMSLRGMPKFGTPGWNA